MTAEQVEQWNVERKIAEQSGDPKLVRLAEQHRDEMMMHCVQRQADRIKAVKADVDQIKTDVSEIKESIHNMDKKKDEFFKDYAKTKDDVATCKSEMKSWKDKAKGAKLLWDALKIIVGAGGGAALMQALAH